MSGSACSALFSSRYSSLPDGFLPSVRLDTMELHEQPRKAMTTAIDEISRSGRVGTETMLEYRYSKYPKVMLPGHVESKWSSCFFVTAIRGQRQWRLLSPRQSGSGCHALVRAGTVHKEPCSMREERAIAVFPELKWSGRGLAPAFVPCALAVLTTLHPHPSGARSRLLTENEEQKVAKSTDEQKCATSQQHCSNQ